ncbi:RsmB/NOP family class I SAM-dependent RNA methyltransferase [Candidatus Pacearchaeota archaeon]|nr:RsmB/NOP family class I SAM-dependent RNA methyltransferase [Candidatus Pacearchaeota archaeon]
MRKPLQLKPAFIERMQKLLSPADYGRYKKSLGEKPAVSFRCNTLKISSEKLKKRLEDMGWKISQPWKDYQEVFVVEGKYVSKKEADEIEKKLMNKKINVNIRKNLNYGEALVLENDKNNHINKNGSKNKVLTINNEYASKANLSFRRASESEQILIHLEPGELGRSLEHLLGYYYIQDLASMLPVLVLEPKPNELVLDLCSSPGSKTTQIASCMENKGTIIANEVSLSRIKILASNLERCGCSNTIITRKDGIALCKRFKNMNESASFGGNEKMQEDAEFIKSEGFLSEPFGGKEKVQLDAGSKTRRRFLFDRILIDAPCSGEGTLRSSPKTALMWNPHTIKSLSKLQKPMVESALDILKPNGIIVYSTCTHAPEENEEVLDYILNKFPNVKIESIKLPLKCRPGVVGWENHKFNSEVTKSCRIYPHDTETEGFFVARLRKIK